MTIDVKGTKSGGPAVDPAERFALKEQDKLSAVPKGLALAFVGVALYLKSIFPAFAGKPRGEETAPVPEDPEPEGGSVASIGTGQVVNLREERPRSDDDGGDVTVAAMAKAPTSLAVIRLTDISLRTDRFTLDSISVVVQPDTRGLFPRSPRSNTSEPPPPPGLDAGEGSLPDAFAQDDTFVLRSGRGAAAQEDGPKARGDASPEGGEDDPEDPERNQQNRAPRVDRAVYLNDVIGASILVISLADLLRHASDPDGDALSVRNLVVSSGALTAIDGGWTYQATGDFTQPVVFSYAISDGSFEVAQTAHLTAIRPWIEGTDADDLLLGTVWDDDISAGAGNDNIDGRSGDDVIAGGAGDDHIVAGLGNDTVFGGAGDDIILGQGGDDHLFGGTGDDALYGGDGNDLLFGGEGADLLLGDEGDDLLDGGAEDDSLEGGEGDDLLLGREGADVLDGGAGEDSLEGGEGDDLLLGGEGADVLDGGEGSDSLEGGEGDDLLLGGDGDDLIDGGAGSDELFGGAGEDRVVAAEDGADDWFYGGDGFDLLDYSQTEADLRIDLAGGQVTGDAEVTDYVDSFEQVIGGSGDDHFIVGNTAVILSGGEGENTFEFPAMPDLPSGNQLTHEITDFKYGDKIAMSHYRLFDKVIDTLEDEFEALYGDDVDEDDIPIRVRHETVDDVHRTVIEADFNDDEVFETTVYIQGQHVLVITEVSA